MLRVRDLATDFLGPLSFELAEGEALFLAGASGAGKSLLLRSLADLDPHAGSVELDGEDQAGMPAPLWRRQVGLLTAECSWWRRRVGEHFTEPVAPESLAALDFDAGVLGWEVSRLSTGESQRLGLLRLLSLAPRVLLLDEPSANLDEANTLRMERLLDDYRKTRGAALLWASHDSAQRERMGGRSLRIREGKLEA